jgi:Circularly permutated YpsA SLOG family
LKNWCRVRAITGNSIMLDKVISGGETGAEKAARQAAIAFGVPTGGWKSDGFLIGVAPRTESVEQPGAAEMPQESRPAPSELNVQSSDATLWFGETTTAGAHAAVGACHRFGKPCMPVSPNAKFEPSHVAAWIAENQIRTLNVTGNREEVEPGIGEKVERFLCQVLEQLGHKRA